MRNFLTRTASAIVFVILFLGGLLWHPTAFAIIFTAVVAIMSFEYMRITLGDKERVAQGISIFANILTFLLFFAVYRYGIPSQWLLIIPLMIIPILISALYCKDSDGYKGVSFTLSSILYIALPFALTNLVVFNGDNQFNGIILLSIMVIIWASDVGAYLFGITLGRKFGKKLFPSVSPNKSWVGYFGGLIISVLAGYAMYKIGIMRYDLSDVLMLTLIINITSTFGDLVESQLKRNFGVKDSGKIMPGHGGLLDRFDGALFAFPAAVAYIILTNL